MTDVMEKQIKDAIEEVKKQVEMNPYLETKTMNYIANKSAQSRKRRKVLTRVGVATLSISTMVVTMILPNLDAFKEEPVQPISEAGVETHLLEPKQTNRGVEDDDVFASFISYLDQLGITYDIFLKFKQPEMTIYQIEMEEEGLFFIKLNEHNLKDDVCLIIDELLVRYEKSQVDMKQLKIDELHYVIYQGNNHMITKYLNEKAQEFSCE